MISIDFIDHKKLSLEDLNKIIVFKSLTWSNSFEEHLNWIRMNIRSKDMHVLLKSRDEIIAYLNLVQICLSIDKKRRYGFGIGNVCSNARGKGYGARIIEFTNNYIWKHNRIGLLFCRPNVISFYSHFDWKVVENEKLKLKYDNGNIVTMIYNFNAPFDLLEYTSKFF